MLQQITPLPQRTHGIGRLATRAVNGQTRATQLYQEGAFKARCVPSHGADHCEIALINTAGGLTGGDVMTLNVNAGLNTKTVVTTQACEKFYRSDGAVAAVDIDLRLNACAQLHWLPQESILFNQSQVRRRIDVEMAADARLLLAETLLFGRQASGERYSAGSLCDHWTVRMTGRHVHSERLDMHASALEKAAHLAGYGAMSTVLLVADDAHNFINSARKIIAAGPGTGAASVWHVGGGCKMLVRTLAKDGYHLRKMVMPVLRLLGGGAPLPKLWQT
ncbi:MAG: urease accessory protein UreD [Pseudomonadota bacterium]